MDGPPTVPLGFGRREDEGSRVCRVGGECATDNYLPACRTCNRLRWHYPSQRIRKIIRLGVYMLKEIENGTDAGRMAKTIYHDRLQRAKGRRK